MDSRDIRRLWSSFFAERGHRGVPSSSLIPPPDERTLLFANAGMNQMKPYFMALGEPPARRMTSIQKCFRTSDIEEVGDNSHCTFFEMLGNFSVGDYFKAEVIPWAAQLLTAPEPAGMGLSTERIWTTVYLDDDEAFDLWRACGIPAEHIVRFDESENYWFMIKGGAGPCGPNSEIYYDFGASQGCGEPGCSPPTHDCGRFLEIWNLVFMSLYQEEDGKTRRPLPQRNVDTGAGLERWPPVYMYEKQVDWQGKPKRWDAPPSIYDTDLFRPILGHVEKLAGISYDGAGEQQRRAMRIVAEHARAATFLIADGVTPANDGRGYVLRRLIRRGTNLGQSLVQGQNILESTAAVVVEMMAEQHENLKSQRNFVLQVLKSEESRFLETLFQGHAQLAEFMRQSTTKQIEGRQVFFLWDTHGFPPELTLEMLAEEGFTVADPDGFDRELAAQRERSRGASQFDGDGERIQAYAALGLPQTHFVGYETLKALASVAAVMVDGVLVQSAAAPASDGKRVEVVLDQTPFYAEGGGQVGDRGEIGWPEGVFAVEDTQALAEGGLTVHIGRLTNGTIAVGDPVEAIVDEGLRSDIMRNHTATHLLHAALRQVLGPHVRQAGSLVAPERLRFDFTHLEAVKASELEAVEQVANRAVRQNLPVHIEHQKYEDALRGGALAFFGDKYADTVRVVGVCEPDADACFSRELCGGTHVRDSGEVGAIVITGETSIGAGMRRIEAVTGRAAIRRIRHQETTLATVSGSLRTTAEDLPSRIEALQDEIETLRKRIQVLERQSARDEAGAIADSARQIGGVAVIATRVDAPNADFLRDLGDGLKTRLGSAAILLAADIDGRPVFLAMSTPDVARRLAAGDLVRAASQVAGGGGGGRPELAQGGGTDVSKIEDALAAALHLAEEKLS